MDVKAIVFGTVGGLGLFLYGMGLLSDGLKAAAGNRLRNLLATITKWNWMAMLVGAGVTCLVQSSSATTVMVVGLVHAGMLGLRQAICVVLGANIGTTFTAWLVAGMSVFKITSYALPAIGVGFLLHVLGRRARTRNYGLILLGFGILFIGINFMQEAFDPLRDHQGVRELLSSLADWPILGILAGTVVTMLVQSSSAAIAMAQTMVFAGAFGTDYDVALRATIPFLLGSNIGTTITAQLAALRTNLSGRRTAMAHTLFNVLGVVLVLPMVYLGWYDALVKAVSPVALSRQTVMLHMAVAHSVFNISAAVVVLPLVRYLEAAVLRILPARGEDEEDMAPVTLEVHLLDTPPLAMDQAHKEMVRMAKVTRKAVRGAMTAAEEGDLSRVKKVQEREDAVDDFQTEITRYLVELSQRPLDPEMSYQIPVLLHSVNDLERIADHAVNLVEIAARKVENKHGFSKAADQELRAMSAEVRKMFKEVLAALESLDPAVAEGALVHEKVLNRMQADLRNRHVERLTSGDCGAMAGLIYVDLVDNLEKIGDHLSNIAEGIVGGMHWNGDNPAHRRPPKAPAS